MHFRYGSYSRVASKDIQYYKEAATYCFPITMAAVLPLHSGPNGFDLYAHDVSNLTDFSARQDEIMQAISTQDSLNSVSFESSPFSPWGQSHSAVLGAILRNTSVREVSFNFWGMEVQVLGRFFGGMQENVKVLKVSAMSFDDAEAAARLFRKHTRSLQELELHGTAFREDDADVIVGAIAKSLRFRTRLEQLSLSGTLSDTTLESIGEALQRNSSLKYLSIYMDHVDISGSTALSFAFAIERNESLKELSLWLKTIPPAESLALLQALEKNSTLESFAVQGLSLDNESDLAAVDVEAAGNTSLKSLHIHSGLTWGDMPGNAHLARSLSTLHSLESISLDCWKFDAVGAREVCRALLGIRNFNLHEFQPIDREGLNVLCNFLSTASSLDSVVFQNSYFDDDESSLAFCASLKRNPNIKSVSMHSTNISVSRVAELVQSNNHLTELYICPTECNEEDTIRLADALKCNFALEELKWETANGALTETGRQALIDALANHRKLQIPYLGRHPAPAIQTDAIKFYNERNRKFCPLLNAALPLGFWPHVLERASTYTTTENTRMDMLYFLVKEKCDALFQQARASVVANRIAGSKRKRTNEDGSTAGRGKRFRDYFCTIS